MLLSRSTVARCSIEASHVFVLLLYFQADHCVLAARILLTGFRCFFFTLFVAIINSVCCVCVREIFQAFSIIYYHHFTLDS